MARPWLIGGGVVALLVLGAVVRRITQPAPPPPQPTVVRPPRMEAVSALGTLQPAGDIRKLAAPTSAMGGSPRLLSLQVEEGQRVQQGQLLATFDSRPRLVADFLGVLADASREVEAQPLDHPSTVERHQGQLSYCRQQKRNDKTRRVLEKAFNPEWADRYIEELLFDDPKPLA